MLNLRMQLLNGFENDWTKKKCFSIETHILCDIVATDDEEAIRTYITTEFVLNTDLSKLYSIIDA